MYNMACLIPHFEAEFLWIVSLKVLKTFTEGSYVSDLYLIIRWDKNIFIFL